MPIVPPLRSIAPTREIFGPPVPPAPINVPLASVPRLADATVFDVNGFGTWSELSAGRLRFQATGWESVATAAAPAAGAVLTWPVTRPDGTAATIADICAGVSSRIVQVAGIPGGATNYAVIAGICNAARTEYAFAGVDHGPAPRRPCFRWTSVLYNTAGPALRNGNLGKYPTSRSGSGAVILGYLDAIGLESIDTIDLGTSGTNSTGGLRAAFAANIADLRYFVGFLKRGELASQPADIDVDFCFNLTPLPLSVTVTP